MKKKKFSQGKNEILIALAIISFILIFYSTIFFNWKGFFSNFFQGVEKSRLNNDNEVLIDDQEDKKIWPQRKNWQSDGIIERTLKSKTGKYALLIRDSTFASLKLNNENIRRYEKISFFAKSNSDQEIELYFIDTLGKESKRKTFTIGQEWEENSFDLRNFFGSLGTDKFDSNKVERLKFGSIEPATVIYLDNLVFKGKLTQVSLGTNLSKMEITDSLDGWQGTGNISLGPNNGYLKFSSQGVFDNNFSVLNKTDAFLQKEIDQDFSKVKSINFWAKVDYQEAVDVELEDDQGNISNSKSLTITNKWKGYKVRISDLNREGIDLSKIRRLKFFSLTPPRSLYLDDFTLEIYLDFNCPCLNLNLSKNNLVVGERNGIFFISQEDKGESSFCFTSGNYFQIPLKKSLFANNNFQKLSIEIKAANEEKIKVDLTDYSKKTISDKVEVSKNWEKTIISLEELAGSSLFDFSNVKSISFRGIDPKNTVCLKEISFGH